MSRRGFAGAVVVGAALALSTGTAVAETLPEGPGGCEQDPVICQSGIPVGDAPAAATDDSSATAYTAAGVGAGVALLAGGVVLARRRRSTVPA